MIKTLQFALLLCMTITAFAGQKIDKRNTKNELPVFGRKKAELKQIEKGMKFSLKNNRSILTSRFDSLIYINPTNGDATYWAGTATYNDNNQNTSLTSWEVDEDGRFIDYKYEITYNENGLYESSTDYEQDGNGNLIATDKEEFEYNSNNQVSKMYFSEYDEDKDEFVYWYKREITYNSKGLEVRVDGYRLDSNDTWYHNYKDSTIYDSKDSVIEEYDFRYDTYNDSWYGSTRKTMAYNANGDLTEQIYFNWVFDTEEWIEDERNTWVFEGDLFMEYTFSFYNTEFDVWDDYYLYELTRDANDNIIEQLVSYWDESTLDWREDEKTEYELDEEGRDTLHIMYTKWGTTDWAPYEKIGYTYDTFGNNLAYKVWRYYNDNWELTWYSVDEFNTDVLMANTATPTYEMDLKQDYAYQITKTIYYEFDSTANDYVAYDTDIYYYSDVEATDEDAIEEFSSNDLNIFPNPATSTITINMPSNENIEVMIFDIKGAFVQSINTQGNAQIDITSLEKGMYILKVVSESGTMEGKIVTIPQQIPQRF